MGLQAKATVTAALAERVYADIIDGRFVPGARLKLNGLAESYGTGLIPLREALSRLSRRGFVIPENQKGFRVAPVSRADLIDLTKTRIDIECLALRRSVERADVDWETRVVAAAHRLRRAPVYADESKLRVVPVWDAAHVGFHDALTSACDSPRLMDFRDSMTDHARRYRSLSIAYSASPREVEAEHDAIAEAALNREADKLCALIAQHFTKTMDILLMATDWENM